MSRGQLGLDLFGVPDVFVVFELVGFLDILLVEVQGPLSFAAIRRCYPPNGKPTQEGCT